MNVDDLDLHAPQLAGGISQQPPHLRFAGQVEEAVNVDFDVADGMRKRAGTEHLFSFSGPGTGANLRIHPIDRDENEKYLLVYGDNFFKVYTTGGTLATITDVSSGGTTATAYIDANNATADQLRCLTITDTTIIANKTVALATSSTPSYSITSEWPSYSRLRSHTPAAGTYHRTLTDTTDFPAGYYYYDPSPDQAGDFTFSTTVCSTLTGGTWNATNGEWDNSATSKTLTIRFRRRDTGAQTAWSWTQSTKRLKKTGSSVFNNYIHRFRDEINITGGTGITTGWTRIKSRISAEEIELVEDIGPDAADVTFNGVGDEYSVTYPNDSPALASMFDVARKIENLLRDAGADDFLCEWQELNSAGDGRFVLTCPYRGQNREVISIAGTLSGGGAPFNSFTNTAASGTPDSPFYPVDLRWTRVAAPGAADGSINAANAPVTLTRITTSPLVFYLDTIDWVDRVNGDNNSNPSPKIFSEGRTIQDMGFLRGRFWIAAGESLVSSQANDLYNFYIDDPANVVDSDPIDLPLSSDRVTIIDAVVPWRGTFTVLTEAGQQFELNNPETLTPSSAAFLPTTQFATRVGVRPAGIGARLYFVTDENGRTGLREYYRDDQLVASDAANVTAHVPSLLPSSIRSIAAHTNSGKVFVLPTDGSTMYVYTSFFVNQSKQQSAWTKYQFQSAYRICDIAIIGDFLYLLVERSTNANLYTIERMAITPQPAPTGYQFQVHLDRRMSLTGTYNAITGRTSWSFPSPLNDTSIDTVVIGAGNPEEAGKVVSAFNSVGGAVSIPGRYDFGPCLIGKRFGVDVTLTRPYVRDQAGRADLRKTLLRRKMIVRHETSSGFDVRIAAPARATIRQSMVPAGTLQLPVKGQFQAWPSGDVESVIVGIESSTAGPMVISGIQHVCDIGDVPR